MDCHVRGRRAGARRPLVALGLALAARLVQPPAARACDICSVYTATEQRESRTGWRVGAATQFSSFGTLLENGHEVANPDNQYLDSSVTQYFVGYQITPRIGLQLNLPIIVRNFQRPEGGHVVRDGVSGPGDMSIVADVLAHSIVTETSIFRFSLLGGLKLPTGDSSRILEELHETEGPGTPGHPPSGIHGHDVALGSGSVDGIVGGELFYSYQRAFVTAGMQYAIRTEGSFDYTYANDLTWEGGPGTYLLLGHDYTLAVQAFTTGETKGKDNLAGVPAEDTGVTAIYVGPRFQATWGTSLYAELGADLPVLQHETSLQAVPDYRVRAAAVWRF
jgi:hypothetical protein